MLNVWLARLKIANRELRGARAALVKLVSAATALVLSIVGIILVLGGWLNSGLVIILLSNCLLSVAVGLPAIKTLKTIAPILQRRK